jgi:outer membrane lipoprotein SlyB
MHQATTRFSTLRKRAILVAAAVAAFGASPMAAQASPTHNPKAQACANCATVISSHTYKRAAEHGSGVGVATGAVLGGLLGNQIGSGNGRTLATVAGAVGGSVAGNQIERNVNSRTLTDVRVRMRNGAVRTFTEAGSSRHYAGEHVRVVRGQVISQR